MKTRMKKLISIKSIPILVLALLIVLGTAWAATREPVSGVGKVALNSPPPFKGEVSLSIGRKDVWTAEVEVHPGKVVERPGGAIYFYDIVHIFSDGVDGFTTIGDEIATRTGDKELLNLNGYMEITEGKGWFEGASGRLSVHGEMIPGHMATFEVNGAMSR